MAEPGARRHDPPDLVVEGDEADRVPLAQQHQAEGGDQPPGIVELGEHGLRRAGPGHRAAHVQHRHRAEIGLLFVLLDVQPVVAAQDLPVDVAELVARLVHPMLGEFHGEATAGRAVQPGEEALDHPLGGHFDPAQPGDLEGIQQVESCETGHEAGNVLGLSTRSNVMEGTPLVPFR